MLNDSMLENKVNQFLAFLELSDQNNLSIEIQKFFLANDQRTGKKEVIYDAFSLLLFENDRLVNHFNLGQQIKNDRVIKFDGSAIQDINPLAYLSVAGGQQGNVIQMKGDSMGKSSRRSGRSSSSTEGTNSNNNNNNNNG